MALSFLQALILFAGIHGLLLAGIFLFGQRYRALICNRMLGLFLLCFSCLIIRNILELKGVWPVFGYPSLISNALIPILGPAIYFYVSFLLPDGQQQQAGMWKHFLPALLYFLLLNWAYFYGIDSQQKLASVPALLLLASLVQIAILLALFAYFIGGIFHLRNKELAAHTPISNQHRLAITWVRYLLVSILLLSVIWVGAFSADISFLKGQPGQLSLEVFWLLMSILVYALGYFSLLQPNVFTLQFTWTVPLLDEARVQELSARLQALMQEQQPYLDPDLDLAQLAELLGVKPKQLSYLINTGLNTSFYEYINVHRIEHVKALLSSPATAQYKLEVLAYESGITSSSSFNRLFKKHENMTPKEFRQLQIAKWGNND